MRILNQVIVILKLLFSDVEDESAVDIQYQLILCNAIEHFYHLIFLNSSQLYLPFPVICWSSFGIPIESGKYHFEAKTMLKVNS